MITIEDFRKLELKVAQIKEVNEHPNADKLLVLTLDLGDKTKQVVAGIKSAYTKETLLGKYVVVVDNLEPALLRGVESQGMVLAGSDDSGVVIIGPERPLKLGSVVK
ncbi:MAG: methionine--tRNA ligase subunit beta [Candidatus Omnitrophica bacterium]|jgi:methionyl-tRNA synthetase|nr:methionine--tRNA ligase subunit beta [Candidatus Omnitrophota bacterium]MDD5505784.1 methionine--tRNA ligase subunit beta [Candidatus Omnitrophota bacterium]